MLAHERGCAVSSGPSGTSSAGRLGKRRQRRVDRVAQPRRPRLRAAPPRPCFRRPCAGGRRHRRPWPWRRRSPWQGGCARPGAARPGLGRAPSLVVRRIAAASGVKPRRASPRSKASGFSRIQRISSMAAGYIGARPLRPSRGGERVGRHRPAPPRPPPSASSAARFFSTILQRIDRDLEQDEERHRQRDMLKMSGGVSTAATTKTPTMA